MLIVKVFSASQTFPVGRCTSIWEGTQQGQLTQTGQRDIPYHMTSCSPYKAGEEEGIGGHLE